MEKESIIHEVCVHYVRPVLSSMSRIISSQDTETFFRGHIDPKRIDVKEFFWALFLSQSHYVLGVTELGSGNVTQVVVNTREIFQLALKMNAVCIILCHNHPSGNLHASRADEKITDAIQRFGSVLGIRLIDHVIITSEGYFSFADEGLIKEAPNYTEEQS